MVSVKNKKIISIIMIILVISVFILHNIYILYKHKQNYTINELEIVNVAENPQIKEEKEYIVNNEKFAHISLDDFIVAFEDITQNESKYNSIFENSTFAYLKELHNKYSIVISCYVFYENDNKKFNLSKCTDKFSEEFKDNSNWLKFGFHSLNSSKNYENTSGYEIKKDYDKVIKELLRITGSNECIDNVVRLQNFAGNEKSIEEIKDTYYGIKGVLGADDKRRSYYLNNDDNSYLYLYDYYNTNDINFFKTDFRIELMDNVDEELEMFCTEQFLDQNEIIIVFSHEWKLEDDDIKSKLEKVCEIISNKGYCFDFPMNRI